SKRQAAQRARQARDREERERRSSEQRSHRHAFHRHHRVLHRHRRVLHRHCRAPPPAPRRRRRRRLEEIPVARRPYTEPEARHDLGRMDVKCGRCGALHWDNEKLSKSTVHEAKFGMCCNQGKVVLQELNVLPPDLEKLFAEDSTQAKEFRKNIAQYNTALSFTSLGVKEDRSINNGGGPPIFRIHGELCHRAGALLPSAGQQPTYAQLYIYEPRVALDHRMENNTNLRRDTMEILQRVIRDNHQYAPLFRHAHEVLAGLNADDVSVRLRVAPGVHARRGNLPTADEVAVILPNDQSSQPRDIILRRRNGPLLRISDLHPAYSPLYYVLLFPFGENGWHPDLKL
ncbi:hypothetical protein C8R45DRAFT_752003, partial [Mycena sanguinolenta]